MRCYPLVGDTFPVRMWDKRCGLGELRISRKERDARGVRESERAQDDRMQGDSFRQQTVRSASGLWPLRSTKFQPPSCQPHAPRPPRRPPSLLDRVVGPLRRPPRLLREFDRCVSASCVDSQFPADPASRVPRPVARAATRNSPSIPMLRVGRLATPGGSRLGLLNVR